MTANTKTIAVVICCYTMRRWDDIRIGVIAVAAQSLLPTCIIIVVDHNEALLSQAAYQLPPLSSVIVTVIANSQERGLSGARNTGIAAAATDLVAFLDDDACPDRFWLERLVTPFAAEDVWATGGRSVPNWPDHRPTWFPAEFDWVVGSSYLGMPDVESSVRNVQGASMAFRAAVFDRIGGFTEGFGRIGTLPLGCEETELCIRLHQSVADAKIRYVPSSTVLHRVSADRVRYRYFIKRCYSEGISKAQISQVVGSRASTKSERGYAARIIPRAVVRELRSVPRGHPAGALRAGTICLGLAVTAVGFFWGTARFRLDGLREPRHRPARV